MPRITADFIVIFATNQYIHEKKKCQCIQNSADNETHNK